MWKEGALKVYDLSLIHISDRGWDVKPADPDTELAVELLLHSNNY